jgi:hypothetical protein
MDSLGKWYRAFGGWGMAAGEVAVLLVSGFDINWNADTELVNMYADTKKGDKWGGDIPGELDRIICHMSTPTRVIFLTWRQLP